MKVRGESDDVTRKGVEDKEEGRGIEKDSKTEKQKTNQLEKRTELFPGRTGLPVPLSKQPRGENVKCTPTFILSGKTVDQVDQTVETMIE